jgi:transcriptional regulator with PAS, ATPase and Fis domain
VTARTLTNRDDRGRRDTRQAEPHLIRLLDYERPRSPGSRHSLHGIEEVTVSRAEINNATRTGRTLALGIADSRMSKQHARLALVDHQWVIEDLGSRNGTIIDGTKLDRRALFDGALIELGRTAFLWRMLESERPLDVLATELPSRLGELSTFSTALGAVLANAARIAKTTQDVIVHGETGTGKELVARGIHAASERRGAFVAVNCGALPDTLVESELFGYRKGAFSGAIDDRIGLVRAADGGTLFFDEIGDLPLAIQAALLRVLQEREVLPLGATRSIAVDLRVVAASHRDLEHEVAGGRFREDLLARLAGYVVEIPALRQRREDLGIVIGSLLARIDRAGADVRFAPAAAAALLRYAWPRNVRELEQVLRSAVALADDGVIELEHLPRALGEPPASGGVVALDLSPSDLERRDELCRLLASHRGNIAAVGRELGVARMQIHRWLERFGIDVATYRGDRS